MEDFSKEEQIVYEILNDLRDRRGLKQAFDSIDEDVQLEIMNTWFKIVKNKI